MINSFLSWLGLSFSTWIHYLQANPAADVTLSILLLTSLLNLIQRAPWARGGVLGALQKGIDLLSLLPHAGADGFLYGLLWSTLSEWLPPGIAQHLAEAILRPLFSWWNLPFMPSVQRVDLPIPLTGVPGKLLVLLVAGSFFCAAPSLAQANPPDPTSRRGGGCWQDGATCFEPKLAVSLAGYNLTTKELVAGLIPGACYGITGWANTWHSLGANWCISVETGNGSPATGLSSWFIHFADLVQVGMGVKLFNGGDHQILGFAGFSTGLGPAQAAAK